jgi:Chitin binding Peritrophin-A domain
MICHVSCHLTGLCDEDNPCEQGKYYPDRSNCTIYYYCNGGIPTIQLCPELLVFDIYKLVCITPDSSFDCDYRCKTPAPTTSDWTTATAVTTTTDTITTEAASSHVVLTNEPITSTAITSETSSFADTTVQLITSTSVPSTLISTSAEATPSEKSY